MKLKWDVKKQQNVDQHPVQNAPLLFNMFALYYFALRNALNHLHQHTKD